MSPDVRCRLCGATVTRTFVDLGTMPSANGYLLPDQLALPEPTYPLHALVCQECLLVQLEALVSPAELFSEYAYFSSFSDTWVAHGLAFARAAISELALGPSSLVVEVASNDGYLLQHFAAAGVPVLGVEPAGNVAEVAVGRGIPTLTAFFGRTCAKSLVAQGQSADLLIANNVLAHVPDLDDFVAGLAAVLKPTGTLSIEVPHLLHLLADTQFDTIYHEHFSYFSLLTAERALASHDLVVFDVERLTTHGGSLRIWAAHRSAARPGTARLDKVRQLEVEAGLDRIDTYDGFGPRVDSCRKGVRDFLARARADGATVAAYGAAAKGNTLLNYCGVTSTDIVMVADRNPEKQGHLLPGSHLPVEAPERIFELRPDYVVILPWNLRVEIATQLKGIRAWGGRFVVAVPKVDIFG